MDYLVLIDSNAIIGNGYKIKAQGLTEFFERNKLVIAEVSIEEVVKNYNNHQSEKEERIKKAIEDAGRYGITTELTSIDRRNFRTEFINNLELLNVEVLSINQANIPFIFQKSLNLEKPFKSNKGKETGGFRDALIWNLWLNYLAENHEEFNYILIVNRDNDFVLDKTLHPDLLKDLHNRGIPTSKIIVKSDVKELVEESINYLKYLPSTETIDNEDVITVMEEIIENYNVELESELITHVLSTIPEEYEAEVINVEEACNLSDKSIDTISGNKESLYLYFSQKYYLTVSYFLPKDYYSIEKPKNVEVIQHDWNKYVMHVEETFEVEVGFEATLNMYHGTVIECNYFVGDINPLIPGSYYDDY